MFLPEFRSLSPRPEEGARESLKSTSDTVSRHRDKTVLQSWGYSGWVFSGIPGFAQHRGTLLWPLGRAGVALQGCWFTEGWEHLTPLGVIFCPAPARDLGTLSSSHRVGRACEGSACVRAHVPAAETRAFLALLLCCVAFKKMLFILYAPGLAVSLEGLVWIPEHRSLGTPCPPGAAPPWASCLPLLPQGPAQPLNGPEPGLRPLLAPLHTPPGACVFAAKQVHLDSSMSTALDAGTRPVLLGVELAQP